jgi:hypothetical protein
VQDSHVGVAVGGLVDLGAVDDEEDLERAFCQHIIHYDIDFLRIAAQL